MSSAAAAIGSGRGQLQLYFDDQVDIWKTRGTSYSGNIYRLYLSTFSDLIKRDSV